MLFCVEYCKYLRDKEFFMYQYPTVYFPHFTVSYLGHMLCYEGPSYISVSPNWANSELDQCGDSLQGLNFSQLLQILPTKLFNATNSTVFSTRCCQSYLQSKWIHPALVCLLSINWDQASISQPKCQSFWLVYASLTLDPQAHYMLLLAHQYVAGQPQVCAWVYDPHRSPSP